MQTIITQEAGYEQALMGMALSYFDHKVPLETWWDGPKIARAKARANSLAFRPGGHNKFLESIQVWMYIQAPRAFWSEFDTYRAGITKQSSSTMHTLKKRTVDMSDFEPGTAPASIIAFNDVLRKKPDVTTLKLALPEGWLQERLVCTNYKVLQHIINQRHDHRLSQWPQFCKAVLDQVEHPEFLWKPEAK